MRKSDDRVRITAQLVDAATSSHLWSQTYDRELTDIFAVQSDIAASVATALRVALGDVHTAGPGRQRAGLRALPPRSLLPSAPCAGRPGGAREYYEQALEIDPGFARAWAGLAGVYWVQTMTGVLALDTGREKVRDAAERALALDPTLAEAHLRLANYQWSLGNFSGGDAHTRKAAALEPNNPLVLAFPPAMLPQTVDSNRRSNCSSAPSQQIPSRSSTATRLQPGSFSPGGSKRRRPNGSRCWSSIRQRHPAGSEFVLVLDRQFDEALDRVERWSEGKDRTQCLALIYHGLGRKAQADAALDELIELSEASDPFRVAEVYAYRHEIDNAFTWLQQAIVHYHNQPFPQRPPWAMRHSPLLKPLHDDARWNPWVASTHLPRLR